MATLLTLGCATPAAPSESSADVPHANPCDFLPLPEITDAARLRIESEKAALPPDSELVRQFRGYVATRDAIRACRSPL